MGYLLPPSAFSRLLGEDILELLGEARLDHVMHVGAQRFSSFDLYGRHFLGSQCILPHQPGPLQLFVDLLHLVPHLLDHLLLVTNRLIHFQIFFFHFVDQSIQVLLVVKPLGLCDRELVVNLLDVRVDLFFVLVLLLQISLGILFEELLVVRDLRVDVVDETLEPDVFFLRITLQLHLLNG